MMTITTTQQDIARILGIDKQLFYTDVMIIDNEIMNNIHDSAGWHYDKAKVCVIGILHKGNITQYVAMSENDKEFLGEVQAKIRLFNSMHNLYAFHHAMETGNFIGQFNIYLQINEIRPFMGRRWGKERFYNILKEDKIIPDIKIPDPFENNSGMSIEAWQRYIETGKTSYIMDIVEHNQACLLKEALIFNNRQHFLDNFEVGENGFVIEKTMKGLTGKGKIYKMFSMDKFNTIATVFVVHEQGSSEFQAKFFGKYMNGKLTYHENSNYSKYKQKYGKLPEEGDEVDCIADSTGKFSLILAD